MFGDRKQEKAISAFVVGATNEDCDKVLRVINPRWFEFDRNQEAVRRSRGAASRNARIE